jgi:DNA helicase-2/ATP-dependent DNA helicase PcrA
MLNQRQSDAVEYDGGHLLVLAGAGSGKTRVLVHRIARLIRSGKAASCRIIAMTFTNKAAGEMRDRVQSILTADASGTTMGTFHSICARILRREAAVTGYPENFSIFDSDDQRTILRRILRDLEPVSGITPGSASSFISDMKNSMITCENASDTAESIWEKEMARVYSVYQEELHKAGACDFDDLLTQALGTIRQNYDILSRYQNLYTHVLVDEYQDTNLVQREFLRALTGPSTSVTAVGDDDQSIYAWRGARIENILEFDKDFPGALTIRLEQNYRSTGNILAAASVLVSCNALRLGKVLWTDRGPGDPVIVQQLRSPSDEARWVFEQVAELVESEEVIPDSIAVLYRTNAQSREFETAARMAGMPYEVLGAVRFYERTEVKDLVSYLRLVVNPSDNVSLTRVINRPPRSVGKKGREAFFGFLSGSSLDCIDALLRVQGVSGLTRRAVSSLISLGECLDLARKAVERGEAASEIVDLVISGTGIVEQYRGSDITDQSRLENLEEFRRSVSDYDRLNSSGGLPGFLTEVSLLSTVDEYCGSDGKLALMTLHCAKGLEFDAVFVTGLEEGMLPFVRPGESFSADLEEERRLLYVGMTRARKRLFLTHTAERLRPGVRLSGPSRFITEIAGGSEPGPRKDTPRRVTEKRSVPVPTPNGASYRKDNLVRHPRYGSGLVLKAIRREGEWELTVDFGFDEPKILLTGYVPIEIVKDRGTRDDIL